MVANIDDRSALLVSELTGFVVEEAMKTAGRENPNRRATWPCNRALGAGGQNRSCSIQWAAKQEKFQPKEMCFFLTSTFIELIGTLPNRKALASAGTNLTLTLQRPKLN
jgi:hypothetical protein